MGRYLPVKPTWRLTVGRSTCELKVATVTSQAEVLSDSYVSGALDVDWGWGTSGRYSYVDYDLSQRGGATSRCQWYDTFLRLYVST